VRAEFHAALLAVAADFKERKEISSRRLGRWLTANASNVCGGRKLLVDRHDERRVRYCITAVR